LNKENIPSRAYVAFKSEEQLALFSQAYDGHIFRDKTGVIIMDESTAPPLNTAQGLNLRLWSSSRLMPGFLPKSESLILATAQSRKVCFTK
jgi:hypothetical protein